MLDNGNCKNLLRLNHHLIKNNQLHDVEKRHAKVLYCFPIFFKNTKPTSQKYFQNYFSGMQLVWRDICSLPRTVTIDPEIRYFQYKILHNVLYLNKKLVIFGKTQTKLCSFCNFEDETTLHLFANCTKINILWANIKEFFNGNSKLLSLTPQRAMFGFSDLNQDILLVLNHILYCYLSILFIFQDTSIYSCFQDFLEISRRYKFYNKK